MVVWLRKNLFRSFGDSIVTVLATALLAFIGYRLLRFVFVTGRWEIVEANLSLYVKGSWPDDELWRLTIAVLVAAFAGGVSAGYLAKVRSLEPDDDTVIPPNRWLDLGSRIWPIGLAVLVLLALTKTIEPLLLLLAALACALIGRFAGGYLPKVLGSRLAILLVVAFLGLVWFLKAGVGWDLWGGLVLNLFLAAVSITLCFPFGVMLALGRRSKLPIVRWLSTGYIELFRGVPLIALLLMANVALGFFIPQSLAPGKVVRAIVVFVLFTAAYVAEIVRGGLQSVPQGQIEAGQSLGMSPMKITRQIVLPQALRNVIPALVGQFISLFKDTTLAGAAMGFTDLLAGAEASRAQELFRGQGLTTETTLFVLVLFWAGSYTMSRESQRLETRLGVGER